MKKNLFIFIFILSAAFSSCAKFLEEKNISGITAENYYVDVAGYESLVNSCYASLRDIYGINPSLFEWGTDIGTRGEIELVSGSANDVPAEQLNEYRTLTPDNGPINTFFSAAFSGIQSCNTAIHRADAIPDLGEELKARRTAEVRFLRAYYYYLLVENFGAVPIVEEEFTEPVTHFEPVSEQTVYEFLANELSAIIPSLEADPTKVEAGRVTQGAAKQLHALLYLTKGYKSFGSDADFVRAAQIGEELINGSAYSLQPSFAEVFEPGNEKNREIIFSVQYGPQPGYNGNAQNIMFGWRYWREQGFDEVSAVTDYNRRRSDFMPTQFLYTLFNTAKDARYEATFLSELYATKDEGNIRKGDLRYYFPFPDQPFTSTDEANLKANNPRVEVIRFERWKQAFSNVGGAEKFPMINKFYAPDAGLPYNNEFTYASTKDVFLFRLGETYLITAEAYYNAGETGKAVEKLNVLRERAAKAGQSLAITAADVDLDFILDERAREMAGEYKRWLDLKRTRKLERAFEHNILTKMANPSGIVDNKYYLRPIPQSVIDRDTGEYPQNDGY
ncbi:RagB/SusD family nutrient uptake outer membrane protein [Sphingobacterium corticibacterium]|uniref:RagB/SusD family nutrient uptake outer membrane protein n=1 Tax=Sphingobacterium corticibacterium TaxID=2484746 RepID=A0A4Q6XH70_9SPHI|nr:RagB/SusD family nutrient uptake outer membrane protein [Sphingobacterium corticibacterium]RZF58445.1 RagB/SusD family nutrient uptake outer membrane protein [Sphingobacterium corticibacterium]